MLRSTRTREPRVFRTAPCYQPLTVIASSHLKCDNIKTGQGQGQWEGQRQVGRGRGNGRGNDRQASEGQA
eukprot:1294276-Heterocapsa_arctica.AAC.1